MTTQVFLPTQKEERKKIKELTSKVKEGDRLYNFLTHLNWMSNRVVPGRYYKKRVVSLDTGEITDAIGISLED